MLAWLQSIDDKDLYMSAVTLAEIQAGIEITRDQDPQRAAELEAWLNQVVAATYNIFDFGWHCFSGLGKSDA